MYLQVSVEALKDSPCTMVLNVDVHTPQIRPQRSNHCPGKFNKTRIFVNFFLILVYYL